MAETLSTLSLISYIAAGVFLVISIFLWVFLRIPRVIGDLSGRTARKSIEKMRHANEKTGVKSYRESKVNMERGKVTNPIIHPNEVPAWKTAPGDRPVTELLKENRAEGALAEETAMLESQATTLLKEEDMNATMPLEPVPKPGKPQNGVKLRMLDEVILINTQEVIK